jgi:hypothetical protein
MHASRVREVFFTRRNLRADPEISMALVIAELSIGPLQHIDTANGPSFDNTELV